MEHICYVIAIACFLLYTLVKTLKEAIQTKNKTQNKILVSPSNLRQHPTMKPEGMVRFCKIYINTDLDYNSLFHKISTYLQGAENRRDITTNWCEVYLGKNKNKECLKGTAYELAAKDDFIFWNYYLDVDAPEDKSQIADSSYIEKVKELCTYLKTFCDGVVPACDFEEWLGDCAISKTPCKEIQGQSAVSYAKHFNKPKNRVEYLIKNFDYCDGNDYLANIFARKFGFEIINTFDGIWFTIIRMCLGACEYELVWHEDLGNYIYSIDQSDESNALLEERLIEVIRIVNNKLGMCSMERKERDASWRKH